jgi:hypothetical protein
MESTRFSSAIVPGFVAAALLAAGCGTGAPPSDIVLSAATDTTVRVSWTEPAAGPADSYVVSFKETGTEDWVDFRVATDSMTWADHDPQGKTGEYRVRAVYGGKAYEATETPTSTPVHTGPLTVSELNGPGLSGFGWTRDSGRGSPYAMTQAGSANRVDFYVTDWVAGFAGPTYYIASPDLGPGEPSGIVPAGSWRVSAFTSLLAGGTRPLPAYPSASYHDYTEVPSTPALIGVYTADSCYALVRIDSVDVASGTVHLTTWFQLVKGLRLIQH